MATVVAISQPAEFSDQKTFDNTLTTPIRVSIDFILQPGESRNISVPGITGMRVAALDLPGDQGSTR